MTADLASRVRIVTRQLIGACVRLEYVVALDGKPIAQRLTPLTMEEAIDIARAEITPARAVVLDWRPRTGRQSNAEKAAKASDFDNDPQAA
jgi:hypothetical protein